MVTRGIRNNNPFNIRKSANSWKGKLKYSSDADFEQFKSIVFGLRAGIALLSNAYIRKGLTTVPQIIAKYAPSSENNVSAYCDYIYQNGPLTPTTIIFIESLDFYNLCKCICMYESKFVLEYDVFISVCKKFRLL